MSEEASSAVTVADVRFPQAGCRTVSEVRSASHPALEVCGVPWTLAPPQDAGEAAVVHLQIAHVAMDLLHARHLGAASRVHSLKSSI
jgi:hypothetical protein